MGFRVRISIYVAPEYNCLGEEEYLKEKSKQVERVLIGMNSDAKKQSFLQDADLDSGNTPIHEQGC